ncbi:ubiquinol-cytochrome C chaperone family protein [Sphingomonas sp. ID0503]|uniref:ubiquinol-cytochrome C chaperone family protein n=1 Tax=Sphingomonas sp. ID0503 TaxID=3399691 RepID=UPI003AFB4E81
MSFLARLFGRRDGRAAYRPLYAAVVARARDPFWYRHGRVPDSIDGRFDMVAAILALVLLRIEAEGEGAREAGPRLTEVFVEDMDGQIRQFGFGDIVVGKHIGGIMGALGGRLTAYRAALKGDRPMTEAVSRNIYRDSPPEEETVRLVADRLIAFATALGATPFSAVMAGDLP